MSTDELRTAALALPSDQRARLAHELLLSLDVPSSDEMDVAWASEISRRAQEIAEGTVEPIDGEDVLARVRRRLEVRRA